MPRSRPSTSALCLAAATALFLSACGGEDAKLLPGETAREITANLDTVQQLSDEGDCIGAESAARQVGEQIEAIEGVDRKLKLALEEGAIRLEEVIAECDEEAAEAPSPPVSSSDEDEEEAEAKDRKGEEKEREAEEKEREKAEKEAEREGGEDEGNPELPPQAEGEGKGLENGNGPPVVEEAPEESPSGGVSPGSPVEEGDG